MNKLEKEELITFVNRAKEDLNFSFSAYHKTCPGYVQGNKLINYIEHLYEQQKVKVPAFAAKWISKCLELNWILTDLLAPEAFESNFARNTEEWLRQDKQNYDILARAWLDGYEVEEEQKWVVLGKRGYLTSLSIGKGKSTGWTGNGDKHGSGAIHFDDKEMAQYTAYIAGGTVEKV